LLSISDPNKQNCNQIIIDNFDRIASVSSLSAILFQDSYMHICKGDEYYTYQQYEAAIHEYRKAGMLHIHRRSSAKKKSSRRHAATSKVTTACYDVESRTTTTTPEAVIAIYRGRREARTSQEKGSAIIATSCIECFEQGEGTRAEHQQVHVIFDQACVKQQ